MDTTETTAPDTLEAGAVTPETMNDFPEITGISGRVYRASNLLTELGTRQKNYLRECIAPVYPLALSMLQTGFEKLQAGDNVTLDQGEIMQALQEINLGDAFNAIIREGLEVRLIAALYLPADDRTFRPEDIDDRMDDLDLSWDTMIGAFKSFFTGNMRFSQKATLGFIYSLMRMLRKRRVTS